MELLFNQYVYKQLSSSGQEFNNNDQVFKHHCTRNENITRKIYHSNQYIWHINRNKLTLKIIQNRRMFQAEVIIAEEEAGFRGGKRTRLNISVFI